MQPENQSFIEKNKKELIIIIVVVIIFLIVVGVLFYFKNKNTTDGVGGNLPSSNGSVSLYSKNNIDSNNINQNTGNNNIDDTEYYREGLINIWDKPVAGYGTYTKKGGSENILIFVDSDTGFLYQKNLNNPTSTPTQITTSSYPNVREAYFLNISGQNKVILQYSSNNTVKSVLANIPEYYNVPNSLENITVLDNNITNISVSEDYSKAVYSVAKNKITNNKKDVLSDWYLINSNGTTKIYTSNLSNWKLQITNSGSIFAYSNETSIENSSLYLLNNNTKTLKQIYSGHTGSSYLINNNSLLSSAFTNSGLKIYLNQNFNEGVFSDNNLSNLNFKTLTNKCFLGNIIICGAPKDIKNYDTGLPDAWYQGLTSWQDSLYLVNSDYTSGQLLFDINIDGGIIGDFDLKNIEVTKDQKHTLFINKNDGSLWSLNIDNIINVGTGD